MSGPVDGEGEFHGHPFADGGSTGYPDAGAVLRSYLGHRALEVLFTTDELGDEGAVVFGGVDDDVLSVRVKTATGVRHAGISCYRQAVEEASEMVARHQLDEPDARAGVLLYRIGAELEADLVVTSRGWLLAERGCLGRKHLACIVPPEEAGVIPTAT